jgi:hypothetical protein
MMIDTVVYIGLGVLVGGLVTYLFTKLFYQNLLLVKQMESLASNQREVVQYITDYPSPEEMAEKIAFVIGKKHAAGGFDMSAFANVSPPEEVVGDKKLQAKASNYIG